MDEYRAFKLLAHAALATFNVNVGTFYGSQDTATASGQDQWWVRVKGQGLPVEGLSAGSTNYTAAVDAMVRRLKAHQRHAADTRAARDRARRTHPEPIEA